MSGIQRWWCGDWVTMAIVPSTRIVPAEGRTNPAMADSRVVLPLPFEPTNATAEPRSQAERRRRQRDGGAVVHAHVVGDDQHVGVGERGLHGSDSHSSMLRMVLIGTARSRSTTRSTAIVLAVAVAAVSGCGGDDAADASAGDTALPPLVATTTIWADVTSHVACGEDVVAIIPAGADPHAFEPSLRDRELLDRAGLVVANGSDLEESLVDLLATVAGEGVDVVEISPHVDCSTATRTSGRTRPAWRALST